MSGSVMEMIRIKVEYIAYCKAGDLSDVVNAIKNAHTNLGVKVLAATLKKTPEIAPTEESL